MTFDRVSNKKYIHNVECKNCSKQYERISGNKTTINSGWCSQECRKEWHRVNRRLSTCKQCNQGFWQKVSTNQFCNKKCYSSYVKDNPEEFNLDNRAKVARANSNSESSIQKMRDTKLENGTMVDWKDANWKQYWKKCDELTRKMRATLLVEWDGVDYISGNNIKDNLTYHYSHGEYPTLDHVVPRSECYKQGLTPQQACSTSNLKWTTRRNNSSKGNKVLKTD